MQLKSSLNKVSVVKQRLLVGTLILAGIGIYSNIYSSPFVFDSELRIRDNIAIRQLWPIWGWLTYGQRHFAYFTLALNYALHGYQVWGYHAVNVVLRDFPHTGSLDPSSAWP